ncbi:MAG: response regulator, partial [Pseudomonadota bacterium]|nr:response regulator [Pseudomonadota bacterium]
MVEDNPLIRDALREMLEEDAQVRVVGTAEAQAEACAWMDARTNGCDVAIIDVFLSAGNGLGVLEHISAYARPPARVVLTNY